MFAEIKWCINVNRCPKIAIENVVWEFTGVDCISKALGTMSLQHVSFNNCRMKLGHAMQ